MYRGPTILWKSASTFTSPMTRRLLNPVISLPRNRKLSTSVRVDPLADPTLLAKFKCHPTIPCDIPRTHGDLGALWYHLPDDLLPINWSCDWLGLPFSFTPSPWDTYSMGPTDIGLRGCYGITYPIKGVMYCTVSRVEPGGLFEKPLPDQGNPECMVFEDAFHDYYLYYEFSQGGDEYVAKFRAPRGTTVSDFVKHHFQGGVDGVDMDLVQPDTEFEACLNCEMLWREQWDLARLQRQAQAQSRCACQHASQDAKLKNLKLMQ